MPKPPPHDMSLAIHQYYLALGEFITDFAYMEGRLFMFLCALAKLPLPTGQALLSGAKTDTLVSFIKRTYDANGIEVPELLTSSFDQLGKINGLRNKIVHYPSNQQPDGSFIVSPNFRLLPRQDFKIPVKIETIYEMIADMWTINSVLQLVEFENYKDKVVIIPEQRAELEEQARSAWRYKPHAQSSPRQQPRDKTRKRGGQPQPSDPSPQSDGQA